MNEAFFAELSAWLTEAGLAGTPETAIVSGFCDQCVAAGLPLSRSLLFIDTLHPVHEGRLFRWGTARPKLLCSNMAAPTLTRSLRPGSIRVMWRLPNAGEAAPILGCYKLVNLFGDGA
jgi:hypothetical protein